jgi:hypothetical protein
MPPQKEGAVHAAHMPTRAETRSEIAIIWDFQEKALKVEKFFREQGGLE